MRGHGKSTAVMIPAAERIEKINVKEREFRAGDFAAMISSDLETVKDFLMEEHNAEKLNIDKLCVVGVGEMGSLLAAGWTQRNWSWPVLATGKQGQYVKALVLISPETNFRGLRSTTPPTTRRSGARCRCC